MKPRALAEFPAAVGAVAISLPLVYLASAARFGCAARVSCYFRDAGCLMDCVNPLTQVPYWLILGALAGVLPGIAATAVVRSRALYPNERWVVRAGVPVASLVLAVPGFALLFATPGIVLGLLALPVASGLLTSFNLAIFPDWRAALRS